MKNVSIPAHMIQLNVVVALNALHKIIEPIAFAQPEHKAIHLYHVSLVFVNTTKIVEMMKFVIV